MLKKYQRLSWDEYFLKIAMLVSLKDQHVCDTMLVQ